MEQRQFTLTNEHLLLMKRMSVGWNDCEFGAPEIDPKRPYGNSDVYQDIIEILGLKELREGVYEFNFRGEKWILKGEDEYNLYLDGKDEEKLLEKLKKLHEETQIALSVVLNSQQFITGVYKADAYMDNWVLQSTDNNSYVAVESKQGVQ